MAFGKRNKKTDTARTYSEPSKNPSSRIAYVMMSNSDAPALERLVAAIKRRIPDFELTPGEGKAGEPLVGRVEDRLCAILYVEVPNPISPTDSFVNSAWWWPEAAKDLEARRAHAIVTVMGGTDPRADYILLAKLAAATIDTTQSIGVIWEAADAAWQADLFTDIVDSVGNDLPMPLLFSVKLGRDSENPKADGQAAWLAMTYGLAAFDLMEIEVRGFTGNTPQVMIETMQNIGAYLLEAGPVIADGHTVGPDEQTRIMVRHEESTLNPGTTVYRLYLPQDRHQ
jgi:hypothetical protein